MQHNDSAYSCPRCQIGHLQQGTATLSAVYYGQLLSIADVPAWTCDICQYREFDYDALQAVEQVTGPLTSPTNSPRISGRTANGDLNEISKSPRLKP